MGERILMMPDKIVRSGTSPVYDENNDIIANINYHYFSFKRRLEIVDKNNQLLTTGQIKMFTFRPTWLVFDIYNENIGKIKRLFTLFSNNFIYENNKGESYKIVGNFRARNFEIFKNNSELVITVSSTANFISMRPHSYLISIKDDNFDLYEAINLVEGIRSLVELRRSNSSSSGSN